MKDPQDSKKRKRPSAPTSVLIGLCLLLTLLPYSSRASHLFGADLFYTHVSGHTYTVTMVIYADCDLTNGAFTVLPQVTPEVAIYAGTSLQRTLYLNIQSPSTGVEVTPVCSGQLNNTSCVSTSGTVPGIKKYTYSQTVSLFAYRSDWRFSFTGNLGSNTSAGRSNSLTNITIPTMGSLMGLEATLDNTLSANSSPVYTTIPTPFFCINKAVSYNPGAIDPDGDSLHFALVPGIDRQTGGFTSYVTGRSATQPLWAATGSFSANAQNGQINFIPNQTQRSLVVSKVYEYRNNKLVGTSMREMTFLVFNNCNNNPPGGAMVQPQGGTISNGTEFNACAGKDTIRFQIPGADLDGDTIDMAVTGIPSSAQFSISSNRTTSPVGSFSWNLQGVATGTYTFFITYTDYGCPLSSRQTIAYNVHVRPRPQMSYGLTTPPGCIAKARYQVYPWAGSSPYRLEAWSGTTVLHTIQPMSSPQSDSLSPGTYTLVVRDQYGCAADTQITIDPPPLPVPLVDLILPTCDQDSNGQLLLSAQGGKSPYQYALNGGAFQTQAQFGSLKAGTYTLSVRDAHFCLSDTVVELKNPPALSLDILRRKPHCNGLPNGNLEAFAVQGKAPYLFALNGSGFNAQHQWSGLDAGQYQIEVRDSNQCSAQISVTLEDSLAVHAQTLISEVPCHGDTNGSVRLNGFGTPSTYTYSLGARPLQSSGYFQVLGAGTYAIRVVDSQGCYLDSLVTVPEPPILQLDLTASPLSCFGSDDGEIQAQANGGRSPYLYSLDGIQFRAGSLFSPLAPGTYRVHLMDNNGCRRDSLVSIIEPPVLQISGAQPTDPLCHGGADGTILVQATGGTPPYLYSVNGGSPQASPTLGGLRAGTHSIQVEDARGCTTDTTLVLGEPSPIQINLDVDHPLCAQIMDGEIRIQASGGTPSYTYALGSGTYGSLPRFTQLGSGLYTLHIRDSHLCRKDTTLRLVDSLILHFETRITDVHCHDSSSGIVEILQPRGGEAPYDFGLGSLPLQPLPRFENLPGGQHRVWIRDQHGCMADTQIQIQVPARIIPQVQHNSIACHGFNNGQIQLSASGGSPGYQFALAPGGFQSSGQFINIYAGTYRLLVRDQLGCLRDTTITLIEPDSLEFTRWLAEGPLCHGDSTGFIEVAARGGTPPYAFRTDYNAFESGPRLEGIPAGKHRIQVRDDRGCLLDSMLVLTSPPLLEMAISSITDPTCEQFEDGEILVQAWGGTPPYVYAHNGNPGNLPRLAPVGAGQHHIEVRDQHGCTVDTLISLSGFPPIRIRSLTWTGPLCAGGTDGSIACELEGGRPPYTYQLGQGGWQAHPRFEQVGAGEWRLQIRDSENCLEDSLIRITGPDPLSLELWSRPVSCTDPQGKGQVGAEVRGGTGAYTFSWITPKGPLSTPGLSQAEPGPYRLLVRDENGCLDSAMVAVEYENCCHPFVPNAFTPNGDGLNDQIRILYRGDLELIEWVIVNRYGQEVFRTRQVDQGWDGKFRGVDQDLGTYYYYLKANCGKQDPRPFQMKGDFVLIR